MTKGCCSRPTTSANVVSWPSNGVLRSPNRRRPRTRCGSSTSPSARRPRAAPGGWRGIADYWSTYEFGWHWSPTANQFDAITAVEVAVTEAERLLGHPLVDLCTVDTDTGEIKPAITLVTDNGGPFKSFRFGAFITGQPALTHVRTKVNSPGQNGVRERGFQSLKYDRLYLEPIDDPLDLVREAEAFRVEFNTIRPHEAIAWNRPHDVHQGLADPTTPTFPEPQFLPPS